MSPPAGVNAQLRQLIYYHLDNSFLENALFLAGRLHALEPRNPDAAHLLALCNLRLGRYKAAFDCSRSKGVHSQHLGCAYVFAQACLGLERYDAGAQALEKVRGLWAGRNHWSKHSETSRRHIPDAAACYCMLGKLYAAHGDTKKAIDYYVEALKINSFMWDAFTGLCDIGAVVRPQNVFKITPDMLASISHVATNGNATYTTSSQESLDTRNPFVSTPDLDPFNPSIRQGGDVGLNLGGSNLLSRLNGSNPGTNGIGANSTHHDVETPTANGQPFHHEDVLMGEAGGPVLTEQGMDMAHAPARKPRLPGFNGVEEPPRMRSITSRVRTKTNPEGDQTDIPRPINQNGHKRTVSGQTMQHGPTSSTQPLDPTAAPPRRSTRLQNSISQIRASSSRLGGLSSKDQESKERRELRKVKATGTKGRTGTASIVGRVVSGNRKPHFEASEMSKPESRPASAAAIAAQPPRMAPQVDTAREQEALNWLLDLLLRIGSGYRHLSRYESTKALEAFAAVPKGQRDTPWVLAQIGKAYYECAMYAEAEKIFRQIREKTPSYLEHMEVYSNTLWQLKQEVALGHLAHTLMDQDRLSPQAWCALGNASSLDRQHDDAVKCFARATQLDPKFAYAFTLQGHEHVANEEFDKAMAAYRNAISADNRHYNGWYGLGNVYERMGKYEVAEKHYRAASQINPNNAMILVRIGLVLDRMKKIEPALMQFEAAIKIDPRSIMARFRKSQILLKLGAPEESLKELLYLKDAAPDDPNIHFLLGRCYKKLQDRASAIRHLTIAMNLDPKSHGIIKEVMESIDEDDNGAWSSEDER
ncbi:nuclear protein bima [Cucurbitaria berberidis CBS 394.84]|uniref:Nuclear protein bima n=1 Tax=Cucurbitaria berberidis CBS 394.84 TaxID=1168544 RepID=A0A9P4L3E1_9PLEO|nr:nuclear protein bima [Cucurbitaria berberidis CBS 394.84]KAF1840199.1 nuclear protein bima [Cucurbitaria berberidis CBS 394.84]